MIPPVVRRAFGPSAATALGLALALGQVHFGLAHAHVTTATPAAEAVLVTSPASLTLAFDSALADDGNQIVLYHSDRSVVGTYAPPPKNGNPPTLQTNLPNLSPDVYTVAWTSHSGEDGHILQQFYAFTVGSVPEATSPPSLPPLKIGDTQVTLTANRGNFGPLVIHAAVRDANGKPLTNLQRVILRYQPAGLAIGQDEIVAPASGSDAQTPAFTLGLAGAWQFDVIVRRSGLDDVDATMPLTLAPASALAPATAMAVPPAATSALPTPTTTTVPVQTPPAVLSPTAIPASTTPPASSPTSPPTQSPPSPTTTAEIPPGVPASDSSTGIPFVPIAVGVTVVVGGIGGIALTRLRRR